MADDPKDRKAPVCENGNHTVECAQLAATEEIWGGCLSKRKTALTPRKD